MQTRGSVDHVSISCIDSRQRGSHRICVCRQGSHPQGAPVWVCRRSDHHQAGTRMEHFQVCQLNRSYKFWCLFVKAGLMNAIMLLACITKWESVLLYIKVETHQWLCPEPTWTSSRTHKSEPSTTSRRPPTWVQTSCSPCSNGCPAVPCIFLYTNVQHLIFMPTIRTNTGQKFVKSIKK